MNNRLPDTNAAQFSSPQEAAYLIMNTIVDGYVIINREYKIVYFNTAAKEKLLLFRQVEAYTGMPLMDLVSKERVQVIQEIFADVMKGKERVLENKFVLGNGASVYYEHTFLPAYSRQQEIEGMIICAKDITEKKKAQLAILESEERLNFALEAANHGAWDWDLRTDEVVYSDSYKKMYGFADNELAGNIKEWLTRIHPDDLKKMNNAVSDHLMSEDRIYNSTYRIKGKDEIYRWVLAKGRIFARDKQGKPIRMIGTHTDITESVEKEIKLQKINERFDMMMQATHEMLWEWDIVANQIYRTEDGVKRIYGLSNNSSIHRIEGLMQRIHPEDLPRVQEFLGEILQASHQQTFEIEYRFLKDDGTYAAIYDRCILIRDQNDRPVRIIGSAQDISERKRLEEELLNNKLEYQRLIHQATVDSQEKERAEIGKELHDNVNQVLTTTKLYLDLALENTELKENLIRRSQKNINDVIQEIRLLSRSLMVPTIGDLGLIDSIKDLVENVHLTQKVVVDFTAPEELETLLCKHQKLTVFRIIQESLSNVLRHAKATRASIEIRVEENRVFVDISDNGIGFSVNHLKKGVGLKNIQNRIYLIHGTFQFENRPAGGSAIILQFPIKRTN